MIGYLIDTTAKTVTPVEYDGSGYREIARLIGAESIDAANIDPDRNGDVVYIDDEGLLLSERPPFFQIAGYPQPLCGNGLVLGSRGEVTVGAHGSIDQIRERVEFLGNPIIINDQIVWSEQLETGRATIVLRANPDQ